VKRRALQKITPYIFILPFFVLFIAFKVVPLLYTFWTSFDVSQGLTYVFGLGNYFLLFKDKRFWEVLSNTGFYAVVDVSLRLVLSLSLAIALNSVLIKFKKIFRAIFFLPVLISSVVVAATFIPLLNERYGMVNAIVSWFGFRPLSWLGDKNVVKWSIIGVLEWRWTGYDMVFFLAGLQAIPQELFEAAQIDGADRWHSLIHITLPLLKPVIALVVIVCLVGVFKMFDTPWLLTEGGPGSSSSTIAIYLYRNAFIYGKYAYGCTISVILFIAIFLITLAQSKLLGVFTSA